MIRSFSCPLWFHQVTIRALACEVALILKTEYRFWQNHFTGWQNCYYFWNLGFSFRFIFPIRCLDDLLLWLLRFWTCRSSSMKELIIQTSCTHGRPRDDRRTVTFWLYAWNLLFPREKCRPSFQLAKSRSLACHSSYLCMWSSVRTYHDPFLSFSCSVPLNVSVGPNLK